MNENYGFIFIDTEEKKRKFGPFQQTDEIFTGASWVVSLWPVDILKGADFNYRRPLVPPSEDWELVGLDEVIQKGDEYFSSDWFVYGSITAQPTKKVESFIRENPDILAIRRPKSKPPVERVEPIADNWVLTSERVPSDERSYMVEIKRTGKVVLKEAKEIRDYENEYSQWLDYPAPKYTPDPALEAFEKWFKTPDPKLAKMNADFYIAEAAFKEGVKFAKGVK